MDWDEVEEIVEKYELQDGERDEDDDVEEGTAAGPVSRLVLLSVAIVCIGLAWWASKTPLHEYNFPWTKRLAEVCASFGVVPAVHPVTLSLVLFSLIILSVAVCSEIISKGPAGGLPLFFENHHSLKYLLVANWKEMSCPGFTIYGSLMLLGIQVWIQGYGVILAVMSIGLALVPLILVLKLGRKSARLIDTLLEAPSHGERPEDGAYGRSRGKVLKIAGKRKFGPLPENLTVETDRGGNLLVEMNGAAAAHLDARYPIIDTDCVDDERDKIEVVKEFVRTLRFRLEKGTEVLLAWEAGQTPGVAHPRGRDRQVVVFSKAGTDPAAKLKRLVKRRRLLLAMVATFFAAVITMALLDQDVLRIATGLYEPGAFF
ncbi:MAG: hypothetical protein D6806_14830 [Deltaproteobacteria bacterium]|nr:MAG: hypothetical protein D6806_14830 [Deltaproteobacteria bacterium]